MLEHEIGDYTAKTPRSRALFEEALRVMPGGNSRTTTFFDPYPFYISRGSGARIWDADGVERLDFNGNYTSLILGHANPAVVRAIQEQATRGMCFPGPSEQEIRLAEILTARIPSMEVIRFANSGTEATMHAIRVARASTGRSRIAKFEGAYHGTHDWVLVSVSPDPAQAGSRKRPKSVAWSAGIPPAVLKHVVVLPWNDLAACTAILEKHAAELAALIIDPMLANAGMIPAGEGFLEGLRAATSRLGILLIFDEVISFRVARGGAQERFGVRPDLTTLGKIIGGGLAVGAFGGRAEVMNFYDPRGGRGRINHGGTFNANPLTMAGGVATLEQLTPEAYARLDALGDRLRDGVRRMLQRKKRPGQVTGAGSLFWLHWTKRRLGDFRSARPEDPRAPMRLFMGLVNEGVLMSQRGLGACSLAMSEADVDRFVEALGRVLDRES
ncbi:MAG: aspartate aminotransferase family protein [Candidatus Rokubacteria bacterium]|nr:aspartate aminotransferase family protein [Candidatus Rokubacteria bacterium]MBI3106025.1 aspartate aminotransferase family protein [Candidatus Rokubacteria bacterium]